MSEDKVVISKSLEQCTVNTDEVSIQTVKKIKREGNTCDIDIGEIGETYYFVGKSAGRVKGLKEGDLVIIVKNSMRELKMFYGPIDKDRLYLVDPYRLALGL